MQVNGTEIWHLPFIDAMRHVSNAGLGGRYTLTFERLRKNKETETDEENKYQKTDVNVDNGRADCEYFNMTFQEWPLYILMEQDDGDDQHGIIGFGKRPDGSNGPAEASGLIQIGTQEVDIVARTLLTHNLVILSSCLSSQGTTCLRSTGRRYGSSPLSRQCDASAMPVQAAMAHTHSRSNVRLLHQNTHKSSCRH